MKLYPVTVGTSPLTSTPLWQGPLVACLAVIFSFTSAIGQSANNFDTEKVVPDKPITEAARGENPGAITAAPIPVSTTPSRYIAPSDSISYVNSIANTFSISKRPTDAFGQLQDPDAKPIIKTPPPGSTKRPTVLKATPLSEIIGLLEITTIMPGEKKFLLGTRSIRLDEVLPLVFRGKELKLQVIEVTSRQIRFRNLQNGETAVRKLDLLPIGMSAGQRGITPPGMSQDRANAPIILEMIEPSTP